MNVPDIFLIYALVAVILCVLLVVLVQKYLVFRPKRQKKPYDISSLKVLSKVIDVQQFKKKFSVGDTHVLHVKLQSPKAIVLLFYGHLGNMADYFNRVEFYIQNNYEVMLYDYAGNGLSKGAFTEKNLLLQAEEIYQYLRAQTTLPLVFHGISIGSHFALYLAQKHQKNAQIVLEAPSLSGKELVKWYYPTFPWQIFFRFKLDNSKLIKEVSNFIILHAAKDRKVPLSHSKKLAKLAKQKPIFIEIEKCDHFNLCSTEQYSENLSQFF